MVAILIDTKYANSLWCKNLQNSLIERLRQKRIPFCEIFDTCPADIETVFMIASDREWIISSIKQLNLGGVYPILLCNQLENLPGCIYNCVCSDINSSMKILLDILKKKEKRRIALYGINTNSIADISRIDGLLAWKGNDFDKLQMFINEGSLKECLSQFYKCINDFDAAICMNDFAAVSLVRGLKELQPSLLDNFLIISCAASDISKYYREYIQSLDINYDQYGKAAVYIYEAMRKHTYLSGMIVKIIWSLENEKLFTAKSAIQLSFPESQDMLYEDPEFNEMLIIDKLLTLSDSTEKNIINGLIHGLTYDEIARECFLTEASIKYHIKKLINVSGVGNRQEMIIVLKKYICSKEIL